MGAESARRLGRWEFAKTDKTFAHSFDPKRTIGVQQDVFGAIVTQRAEDLASEFAFQFGFEPNVMFVMYDREIPHFASLFRLVKAALLHALSTK
jgi:hypothetical protein